MPSKSAKQHRFMEAIAHNPAFAKKAGVSQSVGKEFAAADKGKKFVRGGINKQDTHHGKMDMPFNKLNRHAGMKSGGFMKKKIRKFAEGGPNNPPDVPAQEYSEAAEKFLGKADRTDPFIINRMKKAVPDYEKRTRAPVEDREVPAAAPARAEPAASSETISGYGEREESVKTNEGPQGRMEDLKVPVRTSRPATRPAVKPAEDKFISNEGGAATGMTRKGGQLARLAEKSRGLTDEEKEEAGKRAGLAVAGFAAGAAGPALVGGAARLGQGAYQASRGVVAAQRARHAANAANAAKTGETASSAASTARSAAARAAEDGPNQLIARAGQSGAENVSKGAQRLRAQRQKMTKGEKLSDAEAGMKKGGMTKRFAAGGMMREPKAMVGKEVAFMKKKGAPKSMIKHEAAEMGAMKKGGMPMKDGKPAFMQKKMNMGGMAKYARGGGIESRGKTKGTIIKMATGGVVGFARGGGIESKGKTKGTMIKMKGC